MSNTLTVILPKILARGLLALREQVVMPRLVNGDYSAQAASKGTTIDVPISVAQTATDVTPSNTDPAAADTTPSLVQISLNQWKKTDFHLTDKEMAEIDKNQHFIPLQVSEAIRALSNSVNEHIHSKYLGVYGYVGTAGTTPFASTVTDATGARKVLNQQRAHKSSRRGVLDFDADANALSLAAFADADKTLSSDVKIEGEIGRKYGIDWVADDAVMTHTAGTLQARGAILDETVLAGVETFNVVSASAVGNINIGDIFTLAGDSQTYVATNTVSTLVSGTAQALTFQPPLVVAAASTTAITMKATHVVNLAFHRDAFAFANRPLEMTMGLGNEIMSMTDPMTGITLRLEISRQYKQVKWEFDILWGSELVRPALATRIAG